MKLTTGQKVDITQIKKKVARADGENYTGISFLKKVDESWVIDMTNVMDENHGENHTYKTKEVERELDDVVWYLEDDQVA